MHNNLEVRLEQHLDMDHFLTFMKLRVFTGFDSLNIKNLVGPSSPPLVQIYGGLKVLSRSRGSEKC